MFISVIEHYLQIYVYDTGSNSGNKLSSGRPIGFWRDCINLQSCVRSEFLQHTHVPAALTSTMCFKQLFCLRPGKVHAVLMQWHTCKHKLYYKIKKDTFSIFSEMITLLYSHNQRNNKHSPSLRVLACMLLSANPDFRRYALVTSSETRNSLNYISLLSR